MLKLVGSAPAQAEYRRGLKRGAIRGSIWTAVLINLGWLALVLTLSNCDATIHIVGENSDLDSGSNPSDWNDFVFQSITRTQKRVSESPRPDSGEPTENLDSGTSDTMAGSETPDTVGHVYFDTHLDATWASGLYLCHNQKPPMMYPESGTLGGLVFWLANGPVNGECRLSDLTLVSCDSRHRVVCVQ